MYRRHCRRNGTTAVARQHSDQCDVRVVRRASAARRELCTLLRSLWPRVLLFVINIFIFTFLKRSFIFQSRFLCRVPSTTFFTVAVQIFVLFKKFFYSVFVTSARISYHLLHGTGQKNGMAKVDTKIFYRYPGHENW